MPLRLPFVKPLCLLCDLLNLLLFYFYIESSIVFAFPLSAGYSLLATGYCFLLLYYFYIFSKEWPFVFNPFFAFRIYPAPYTLHATPFGCGLCRAVLIFYLFCRSDVPARANSGKACGHWAKTLKYSGRRGGRAAGWT